MSKHPIVLKFRTSVLKYRAKSLASLTIIRRKNSKAEINK